MLSSFLIYPDICKMTDSNMLIIYVHMIFPHGSVNSKQDFPDKKVCISYTNIIMLFFISNNDIMMIDLSPTKKEKKRNTSILTLLNFLNGNNPPSIFWNCPLLFQVYQDDNLKLFNQQYMQTGSILVAKGLSHFWLQRVKGQLFSFSFLLLGIISLQHCQDYVATFQLYWWRKTSGASPSIILGTNRHPESNHHHSVIQSPRWDLNPQR